MPGASFGDFSGQPLGMAQAALQFAQLRQTDRVLAAVIVGSRAKDPYSPDERLAAQAVLDKGPLFLTRPVRGVPLETWTQVGRVVA